MVIVDDGEIVFIDIVIIIVVVFGIDLEMLLSGVFFNQVGFFGIGGLDLDMGNGIGFVDVFVEICDLGLDCMMNLGIFNWLCQIGIVNGVDMVCVDQILIENFDFDVIDKKELIVDVYIIVGIELVDGIFINCVNGSIIIVVNIFDVVEGDVFVVFVNSIYYMICVDVVNENNINNNDSYEFSIKY